MGDTIPIVVDPAVPPGVVEVHQGERVLGAIVNVGPPVDPVASFERTRTALVFDGPGAAALVADLHRDIDAHGAVLVPLAAPGLHLRFVTVPRAAQPEDPDAPRVATSFVRVDGRG